jgi:hypothetical protein
VHAHENEASVFVHVPPFSHEVLSQLSGIHEPLAEPCVVKPLAHSAITTGGGGVLENPTKHWIK